MLSYGDYWSMIKKYSSIFNCLATLVENVVLSGNSSTGMGTAPGIWNDILVVPWILQKKHQGISRKFSAFISQNSWFRCFFHFWKHSLFWPFVAVKSCQVVKALVSLVPRELWQQRGFSEALAYFSLPHGVGHWPVPWKSRRTEPLRIDLGSCWALRLKGI